MRERVLDKRLDKMFSKAQQERPCEECGGPDAPITHEVFWEDSDDADPAEPEEEFCPSCGRQTVTTVSIDWGDDDPA